MEMTRELSKTKISENWKSNFEKYTGVVDTAKVSEENKIGHWTLNSIRVGARPVSKEENKKATEALAKVAIENAIMKKVAIEKDIKAMKKNIAKIFDCI